MADTPTSLAHNPVVEWAVPVAAVALVFVMLVPLPSFLLDLLLATSITASVLVLLSAINILRPAQFSVFPSLLLLLTLFRLSLNLASSRRILLHGNEGASAAGKVIEAFGQFVVGGNYVVGFVLFLALIAIQYIVVSHGAVRTAEVTARFTLDALPGKQMAIDADLNAGLIDEAGARARREQVAHEAEFYGAMDGAARFNQRDALATVLITAVNIIAGFLIGVFQLDIPFREALKTYTVLTVGDGLVTMIPSLLVSMAGGIVVTRASSGASLASDLGRQVLSGRRPLFIAAGVMAVLAAIPGLPKFSFFFLAALVGTLAWRTPKVADEKVAAGAESKEKKPAQEPIEDLLKLDELSLEIGYALIPLVDVQRGGQMLARVRALRGNLAQQLGFIVPSVHITDNARLKANEYVISLRGVEIARWEMSENHLLAISSDAEPLPLAGTPTREPAFGVSALWIVAGLQNEALAKGYAVVDQTSVLATHLAEVIKQHASELLTRHEAKRLLDRLAESHPKLVEELVPKLLSLGEVHKVLQQLLREQVSIRDLATILETLIDTAGVSKHPVLLVEAARQALGRALVKPLLEENHLRVVTLDGGIEEELGRAFNAPTSTTIAAGLQPSLVRRILEGMRRIAGEQVALASPVLLCSTPARFHLKRLLEPFMP
ncbi:MAG TPA: flagellar biosynthesis protein FlhA, partial [Acidobacteriaceae bacterium]|nr:flagellar biosynthesis protein FlhA [Acidobacteriaceae bacterium]